MNQKELYTIPISLLSLVINMILFYRVMEFEFIAENAICFLVPIAYTILTFRALWFCDSFICLLVFSLVVGVGIFFYTHPINLAIKIYLGLQIIPLIALQNINISNNTLIERNENISIYIPQNLDCFVYIIRMHNKNESFIKIGMTNDPKSRLQTLANFGYIVEIIELLHYKNRDLARKSESLLHSKFNDKKYLPLIFFEGRTECFTTDILNDIDCKDNATNMQNSVIQDINNNMTNSEICMKYDLKPYQVTRIKQRYL